MARQVSQVVASEQGCGEHRVVGAYPHCMHMVHTHLYMYGGVCHPWKGSLGDRYFGSHGTLESPIKLTPRMQRPTSCLHSWQINQIWLLLNIICTHLRTTLYIR